MPSHQLLSQHQGTRIDGRLARALETLDGIASSKVIIAAVLLLSLGYLAIDITKGIGAYDEGAVCYGAVKVLDGGIPYRDFWTAYGPGQYYLVAAAFKIFGVNLLTARMYTLAVEWIIAILAYSMSRKLAGPIAGLVSCVTVATWLTFDQSPLYPVAPALLFSMAGFWVAAKTPPTATRSLIAGLLIGCVTLIRYDMGIYAFICGSVILAGYGFSGDAKSAQQSSARITRIFKQLTLYVVGFSVAVLPVVAALLRRVPHQWLYEVFVDLPFRIYPEFRSLPFPPPGYFGFMGVVGFGHHLVRLLGMSTLALMFALPLLIPGLAAIFILLNRSKGILRSAGFWLAAGLTGFGLALWYSVRVRPDGMHMLAPAVISLVLFPWLFKVMANSAAARPISEFIALTLLICVVAFSLGCAGQAILRPILTGGPGFQHVEIERAKGISPEKGKDTDNLVQAVQYIQMRVPPGEPIYVGDTRHDKLVVDDPMFYFLAARSSATRYAELVPGIVTTAEVQSEIIGNLQSNRVKYVVLWSAPDITEPNRSAESSGVRILDNFIRANYDEVAHFGKYAILHRSSNAL